MNQAVIDLVLQMWREKYSDIAIAKVLNDAGVVHPDGIEWKGGYVGKLIRYGLTKNAMRSHEKR